jgi:5-(carboxyamino)imidazole ribonucleotide mutase
MTQPSVGIVMGSDSDLPIMKEAATILEELGVAYELTIASAHRTPELSSNYAKEAEARGLEVIIAGAGGAAHLPGVMAALTPIPVIGVPIKSPALQGLDSLLSITQMPAGIPVATVAINGAKNAGILAAQIVGVKLPAIRNNVKQYKAQLEKQVTEKAQRLKEIGYEQYLSER